MIHKGFEGAQKTTIACVLLGAVWFHAGAAGAQHSEEVATNTPTPTPAPPAEPAEPASAAAGKGVDPMKEANNPLSNLSSFSLQDYAYVRHAGVDEANSASRLTNTAWLRIAQSFGSRVLSRVSLPVETRDDGTVSGLGDLSAILPVILSRPGATTTVGLGPAAVFPTHTDDTLGSDVYGVGAAFTFFYLGSKQVQVGSLMTFLQTVKPDIEPSQKQSILTYQPFVFWQLGAGYYLRSSGIMSFDMSNQYYNVPVGIGAGKVAPVADKVIFNLYAEFQQSIWSRGTLQPTTRIFFGISTQLVPKHH